MHRGKLYAFASRFENNGWNDVTQFESSDLVKWSSKRVIEQNAQEHLFNSSVCQGPKGFVMAYESDDRAWPAFTVKFAQSKDLVHWTTVPEAIFGKKRYTACPTIRFAHGYYYVLYTEHRTPRWFFETYIARSKDLVAWELSGANPVLTPQAHRRRHQHLRRGPGGGGREDLALLCRGRPAHLDEHQTRCL